MRLFVALRLPEHVIQALERIQQGVPAVRWVPGRNMHLTLRFIGETDSATLEDLVDSLADIVMPTFEFTVAGVGHFKTRRAPTTLWAGIHPSPKLKHLQNKMERAIQLCGFAPERRKFTAHITLARLGDADPLRIRNFLQRYSLFEAGAVLVDGFSLYSSHLGKGNPIYRAEVDYYFEEPSPAFSAMVNRKA